MNPIMRAFLGKGDDSQSNVRSRSSADAEPPSKRKKSESGASGRNKTKLDENLPGPSSRSGSGRSAASSVQGRPPFVVPSKSSFHSCSRRLEAQSGHDKLPLKNPASLPRSSPRKSPSYTSLSKAPPGKVSNPEKTGQDKLPLKYPVPSPRCSPRRSSSSLSSTSSPPGRIPNLGNTGCHEINSSSSDSSPEKFGKDKLPSTTPVPSLSSSSRKSPSSSPLLPNAKASPTKVANTGKNRRRTVTSSSPESPPGRLAGRANHDRPPFLVPARSSFHFSSTGMVVRANHGKKINSLSPGTPGRPETQSGDLFPSPRSTTQNTQPESPNSSSSSPSPKALPSNVANPVSRISSTPPGRFAADSSSPKQMPLMSPSSAIPPPTQKSRPGKVANPGKTRCRAASSSSPVDPSGKLATGARNQTTKELFRVAGTAAPKRNGQKGKSSDPNSENSKIRYKQQYLKSWEAKLKWLEHKNGQAHCGPCDVYLMFENGGLKDLKNHEATEAHQKNASATQPKKNHKLFKFMASNNDCTDGSIRLCLYAVQKNLSFKAVEALVPVLQKTFHDSKIAAGLKLHRTKVSRIMVAVTGETQKERLVAIMRSCCFSIIVDESTDVSTAKVLCIVVRYYDAENDCTRDALYDLIHIDKGDAETLYNAVVGSFNKNKIPYKRNLQGLATDNAKVMTGDKKSLYAYLKRDVPHLVLVRCVCHSMALCASYASKQLPEYLEQLLKDIYSYLSASPARLEQYDKIQSILEYNPTRIPRLHDIRFLSRGQVVKAVLSRYDALQCYFGFAANVDQISNAGKVHTYLSDNVTRLYLEFLNFVLPVVDGINLLFQSEEPEVITMVSTLQGKITQLLGYFIKPEVLQTVDLRNITFDEETLKPAEEMYLGVKVAALLNTGSKYDETKLSDFYKSCASFYQELAGQMLRRFQLDTKLFDDLKILEPHNVMSRTHNSVAPLLSHFGHLFPEEDWQPIDDEFNEVMSLDFNSYGLNNESNADRFWRKLITLKRRDGEYKFPGLRSLLRAVFALPHSSAAAERIFSAQNLNKTKLRNKLKNATLVGILRTKDWLKANGNAGVVHIPSSMRNKMNKTMYETIESDDEEESAETLHEVLTIIDS